MTALARHLRAAIVAGTLAGLSLSVWNVIDAALAARLYRQDPGRLVELFGLCLVTYIPLALAPLLLLSLLRLALVRENEATGSPLTAFHAGAAFTVAAALFFLGVLAQRDPPGSWEPRPLTLDVVVALAAALSSGVAVRHLVLAGLRRSAPAPRLRAFSIAAATLPLALIVWAVARDQLGKGASTTSKIILAVAAMGAGAIGAFLAGRVLRAAIGFLRRRSRLLLGVSLCLLAGGGVIRIGLGAASVGSRASQEHPNILVIVADTLRADHVGCYGTGRTRTPQIDRIAAGGVRFDQVYASSAWTAPATASLLTALYPGGHGLLTYHDQIREGAVSVAAVFSRAGYETAGFSANPILSARYGFGGGFDTWEEEIGPDRLERHRPSPLYATLSFLGLYHPADRFPSGEKLVSRALSWLDGPRRGAFFLYVHFMDAHDPYAPPPPFATMYGDPSRSAFRMRIGTLASIMDGKSRISRDDLSRMKDLYDGAVSYIDDQVGRLMEELRRRGLSDHTLVVFTADHGEEFLDHGDLEHTRTLYEEITRIPLVLAGPGVSAGRVIEGPARQVDIAPTLLGAVGLEFPGRVDGVSLWRPVSGAEAASPKDAFMELSYSGFRSPWHSVVALRRGGYKLVGTSFDPGREGPWTWSLFDLGSDPRERSDASGAHPVESSSMRESLRAWSRRPRASRTPGEVYDEETERRLRALGYID